MASATEVAALTDYDGDNRKKDKRPVNIYIKATSYICAGDTQLVLEVDFFATRL